MFLEQAKINTLQDPAYLSYNIDLTIRELLDDFRIEVINKSLRKQLISAALNDFKVKKESTT
jgi:hypothetical protein